jgi:HAD superfamily hydrolase (TIGR01509 family)
MQALLFDLDGTLLDNMAHHDDALRQWHTRHGLALDTRQSFAATAGRSNEEYLRELFPQHSVEQRAQMADEKEAIYRELAARALPLVAGAAAFVAQARQAGLRLAVCTASTPQNMALAFDRHGIDRWVDTVVSPADGLRGKPHPDLFLEAARRLGVSAAQCMVFEDAPLGVLGAQRAGMRCVALTTTLPASAFLEFDNVIASAADFTSLSLAELIAAPLRAPHDA